MRQPQPLTAEELDELQKYLRPGRQISAYRLGEIGDLFHMAREYHKAVQTVPPIPPPSSHPPIPEPSNPRIG